MTQELVKSLIETLGFYTATASAVIVAINKGSEVLKAKYKESSVGATAILNLVEKEKKLEDSVEWLKAQNLERKEEIEVVETDLKDFTKDAFSLLKLNK